MCVRRARTQVVILISMLTVWSLAVAQTEETKIKVTVYYESLCPDSRKFINTQLYPALTGANNTFADLVHLQLVPFGKSTYIYDKQYKEYNFTCHHGEEECLGNRIHACGLQIISGNGGNDDKTTVSRPTLDFINCLMAEADRSLSPNTFPTKRCAEKSQGVNYSKVENCAKHVDGQGYLAQYGFQTEKLRPPLTSVPTITFDDVYDHDVSRKAEGAFVGTVCELLKKKGIAQPMECDATGAAGGVAALKTIVLIAIACLLSVAA